MDPRPPNLNKLRLMIPTVEGTLVSNAATPASNLPAGLVSSTQPLPCPVHPGNALYFPKANANVNRHAVEINTRRPRARYACSNCSIARSKCERDDGLPEFGSTESCHRCIRLGLTCVYPRQMRACVIPASAQFPIKAERVVELSSRTAPAPGNHCVVPSSMESNVQRGYGAAKALSAETSGIRTQRSERGMCYCYLCDKHFLFCFCVGNF